MTVARSTFHSAGLRFGLALAAPLALAACSDSDGLEGGAAEPIAPIAAPEGTSWTETYSVSEDGEGYILGNPDAPLKVVEYASHTCGACANFAINGKPGLKENYVDTGVVSLEQREIFLRTEDVAIATLTRCAGPDRMQPLSDEVWRNLNGVFEKMQQNQAAIRASIELPREQRTLRVAELTGLVDFFAARGLPSDQARACLQDADAIEKMIEVSQAKAIEAEADVTPTFTLNGRKVNANQWPGLEPILQGAGARTADSDAIGE